MKNSEKIKIYQILGNISGCQETLKRAIERKDFDTINECCDYLTKISERLEKLTD